MKRRLAMLSVTGLLAGALFVAIPSALADDPPPGCSADGALGFRELTLGGDTYYIEDRDFVELDAAPDQGGTWIYKESNGVGGLQRGGASAIVPNDPEAEACTNESVTNGGDPDELIV